MTIVEEEQRIKGKLEEEKKSIVSVALFGQPGAGKSTLINKLVGENVAETGVETDKTVKAATYEAKGLKFVDLPGYGTKNFPKETYFTQFNIDSFDLFLCVTSGKLHAADTEFFSELSRKGKVCIFVVNKHDELWEDKVSIEDLEQRKRDDISKHVGQTVKVLFTSCRNNTGLDQLTLEIYDKLDAAKRVRWARSAKAYSNEFLEEKKAACERHVVLAAGASAGNALNPIPGVDVAVDLGVLMTLFKEVRESYGLDDKLLASLKNSSVTMVVPLANRVVEFAAKQGLIALLKTFAGKQVAKSALKYVPIVGQAIAASLGFAITYGAGTSYLNDCHALAKEILDRKLNA